jgi:hypothetical protein
MRYSLLILAIDNPRARKIVAHNLAGNRRISLSYAQSMLENVPVEYQTDLTKDDAEAKLRKLTEIGVRGKIVSVDIKTGPVAEPRDEAHTAAAAETLKQPTPERISIAAQRISFKYTEKNEPPQQLKGGTFKKRLLVIGLASLSIAIAVFFIGTGNKWRLQVNTQGQSGSSSDAAGSKKRPVHGGREAASESDKLRSDAYADSGKAIVDPAGAIAFYKLAIGFNKYNANAWYGLLAAYTAMGSDDKAQQARDKMAAIFGEDIFSMQKNVERFGELLDAYTTADGTFHLEYRSREIDKNALLHETYLLARALGANRNPEAFSLYAHAPKGLAAAGVLVYAPKALLAGTFPEYREKAKITELH